MEEEVLTGSRSFPLDVKSFHLSGAALTLVLGVGTACFSTSVRVGSLSSHFISEKTLSIFLHLLLRCTACPRPPVTPAVGDTAPPREHTSRRTEEHLSWALEGCICYREQGLCWNLCAL